MHSYHRGFSIAEMVISVAILAIMAAIVVPNANRYISNARIQSDADLLDSVGYAKIEFTKAMDLYPGKLSQLGSQIHLGDSSICNHLPPSTVLVAFVTADTGQWAGSQAAGTGGHAGPYLGFPVPTTGLQLHIGTALNQMRRTTNNTVAGFMQVVVPSVTYADALALNQIVDGGGIPGASRTDTSGTVRWTAGPAGPQDTVTLTWNMAVGAQCTG